MKPDASIHDLMAAGAVTDLDVQFGRLMERLSPAPFPGLSTLSALVSAATREGNVCLDLSRGGAGAVSFDPESILRSGVVGVEGEYKPLVLTRSGRVYLHRYWEYERKLAEWIRERAARGPERSDDAGIKARLKGHFPELGGEEVDWQAVAAFASLVKSFLVISGGPGTGKTTTAAKILACLLEESWPTPLRIGLAAPTGKGAARLQSAVRGAKESLRCADEIKAALPESGSTIHRLLGAIRTSPYFRHDAANPLPLDLLLIDEASMVDLALMSKVVQALPPKARLILLGDRDQLASVEAGAVLGDICRTGSPCGYTRPFCSRIRRATGYAIPAEEPEPPPLGDCIVHLRRNYRFGSASGIASLGSAVNRGDGPGSLEILLDGGHRDVAWVDLPPRGSLRRALRERVLEGFGHLFHSRDPEEVSRGLGRFRILCALREGVVGAPEVNRVVEEILREEGLIRSRSGWYEGRPVLVSRNAYELRLFNGDTGVALPEGGERAELRVFFPESGERARRIHPSRLPEHETCYAMTVHKSQGSEFERVLLILPDRDGPILTRELIYTALTRAIRGVEIWGRKEVFRAAVERRTERRSGLRGALWGE